MNRRALLLTAVSLSIIFAGAKSSAAEAGSSPVLAVMAEGIGDMTFASAEWVDAASEALSAITERHADSLNDLGSFAMCVVAHNPPGFLHVDSPLAWYAKFNGSKVEVGVGELADGDCDLKIQGDHSIMSILGHIQYHGNDPVDVAAAQSRLRKLSRWEVSGANSEHKALGSVLRSFHDVMAVRTMPRFIWMSPEWVEIARYIVSTRARMEEYADGIRDVEYTFSEVFTDPPTYVFPNGGDSGFWVVCSFGEVTVGAGPLPEEYGKPGYWNQLLYTPVVPVGRTVNALMTDADNEESAEYSGVAFSVDVGDGTPIRQSDPSKNEPFPPGLSAIMSVLHDELSYRTSGELPSDYDDSIRSEWSASQKFDRPAGYDASWLLYDRFDIYGNPR